jgi:hypothetical protein
MCLGPAVYSLGDVGVDLDPEGCEVKDQGDDARREVGGHGSCGLGLGHSSAQQRVTTRVGGATQLH